MSDIFISYAREDRQRAQIFAEALQKQGWSVWWDRNILSGKLFDEVIEKELYAAKCVIVLWSENSIKSDWVKEEAAEGKKRDILVPVLINDVPIPLGFRRIQTSLLVNWSGTQDNPEYQKLLDSIQEILAPPGEETTGIELSSDDQQIQGSQMKRESNGKGGKKIFFYITVLFLIILVFLGIKFGPTIFKQDKGRNDYETPPDEYTIDVYADKSVTTGINVESGDILEFEASGTWSWGRGTTENCSPDGTPGRPHPDEYPVTLEESGVYFGMLIGRIDENPPFKIGSQGRYRVPENRGGRLILLMNDRIGCYTDNSGSIKVIIRKKKVSTIGGEKK